MSPASQCSIKLVYQWWNLQLKRCLRFCESLIRSHVYVSHHVGIPTTRVASPSYYILTTWLPYQGSEWMVVKLQARTTVQICFLTFVSLTPLPHQLCWMKLDVSDETSGVIPFSNLCVHNQPNQTTNGWWWCLYWVWGWNEHLNCLPPASNQTSTCHIKHLVDARFKAAPGSWWTMWPGDRERTTDTGETLSVRYVRKEW